jgi:UDP-N-acetylglucosamine transferase subunit ALG13
LTEPAGLLVAVGTFVNGFDELVEAADRAAAELGIGGFAQIGGSRVRPRHLDWARFLPPAELRARIARARVVVCHGGVGILGDAMRAGRPIVAMPRRGPTTFDNPSDDQLPFLRRLAERYPIGFCEGAEGLCAAIARALAGPTTVVYPLGSDVPEIVARFLAADQAREVAVVGAGRPSRWT